MAQYERFLSYLFEYDQDTKGANCGFAKIEVRGETKRIQITIKGRMQVELLHVCAFYREGERCICVPLGRMMVNGGNGQFQYASSGTYLSGSQVMFSQVKGLVLSNPQSPGQAYATVWDDEPFGLSMFEQEAEPEEDIRMAEMTLPGMWRSGEEAGLLEPGRIVVIRRDEMESAKEDAERVEAVVQDIEDAADETVQAVEPEADTAGMEYMDDAENAHDMELGYDAGNADDVECADAERNADGVMYVCDAESTDGVECACDAELIDNMGCASDAESAEDTECASGVDPAEAFSDETLFSENKQKKPQPWEQEDLWNPEEAEIFWAGLCRRFPKIESLPGDNMVCLRAVPADIGRLPRPNWIFGNNGFLMYSYVRYRYIVFARVAKEAFELWLPGTYGKNEEVLARMFGFERFRSMKSMDAADGDFGYWCVPIDVPQVQMALHG